MAGIIIRELNDFNWQLLDDIKKLEERNLGRAAAINEWIIPVIIRYGKIIIAQDTRDQGIIGVCELLRSFKDEYTAFIHSFYIDIPYRRKGAGKKLLGKAIRIMKTDKIKTIELTVDPGNTIALSFYGGFGFEKAGIRKNEYGRGIDRTLMRLELG